MDIKLQPTPLIELCKKWLENPYINPQSGCAINPKNKKGSAGRFLRGCRLFNLGPVVTYEQLKQDNEFLKMELEASQQITRRLLVERRELEETLQHVQAAMQAQMSMYDEHEQKN